MRIMIKGGIWKNIEDEILKAAVMKYGLNQWSRISSLLVRKSAKQCKARWYEWLDPSIKKTEWSKEEEEKLLHLAKLFPNQWRTIAPVIGRTPAQCLEHYEQLLEEAAGNEVDEQNDPRRLKPGEIDPSPETRPPRPDPVDMDEDEKEMLQEARARLSNTRGKKAKRKMREKQLEEGRRLATVQRKRELRATGIDIELKKRIKPKVREMNYMVEIPFEHYVPKGIYEPDEAPQPTQDQLMISAQQIEGSMRDELEAKRKIEDEKRMKRLKELDLPMAIKKINKANEEALPVKRSRLILPEPQLTEEQIEQYVRHGENDGNTNNNATDALVGNYDKYSNLIDPTQIITPMEENSIQMEAYNAALMNRTTTPLMGGSNPELYQTDLSSVTPAMTPNLIASQLSTARNSRDAMSLNTKAANWETSSDFIAPVPLTKEKLEEFQALSEKELLLKQLASIPGPVNLIDFDMPEIEDEGEDSNEDMEEDEEMSDLEQEDVKEALKSETVKRDLPRPYVFNPKRYIVEAGEDSITDELLSLVLYDMHQYPMKGGKIPPDCPDKEPFNDELRGKVKKLVDEEMQSCINLTTKDIDAAHARYQYLHTEKKAVIKEEINEESIAANAKIELKQYKTHLSKLENKYEDDIRNSTKDLQKKAVRLEKAIEKTYAKYDTLRIENSVFEVLQVREEDSLKNRINKLKEMIEQEKNTESLLLKEIENLGREEEAWTWANNVAP
ncbi:unnamed protein product [Blepharisma stoltei]|uniref:Uncharacterized protein n=1 Tax=Blepharisma stoltei TaxID=1481888 RepID=A0AAU9KDI7_9CILI|nr:unnamed protein product [Blepharisma stoltei]